MNRLPSRSLMLPLILAVAGCGLVSPEAQLRDRLLQAGIKPHMASCLAPKLVRKLSTEQLQALGKLARAPREGRHHLSIGDLEARLRAVGDPQVVDVVSRAALGCAILG